MEFRYNCYWIGIGSSSPQWYASNEGSVVILTTCFPKVRCDGVSFLLTRTNTATDTASLVIIIIIEALLKIPTLPPPALPEEGPHGSFGKKINSFVQCCLQTNPSDRSTAVDLLKHPFIKVCWLSSTHWLLPHLSIWEDPRRNVMLFSFVNVFANAYWMARKVVSS